MRLKRLYREPLTQPPMVRGVVVQEVSPDQNFSPRFVDGAVREGWLTLEKGKMVIHGDNMTVTYRMVRPPGYYCCHCNRALDDSTSAQEHVTERHAQAPSPDANNPAGYRRDAFFACVLEG